MPSYTVKLPRPHPGQIRVMEEAKRINWLAAGRRWRKTTLCMAIAVRGALRGERILWGAPTSDQTRIGWAETMRAAGDVANFVTSRMTAEFPSGGTIIYRSLDDPNNARGHTANGIVMDEVADVKAQAWYEVLRPMLMDRIESWAWGIGTPKGLNWWYHEREDSKLRTDASVWQVPTLGVVITEGRTLKREAHPLENPYIPFKEVQNMFETMPENVFRQEILAEFIEEGAGIFRNVDDLCILKRQAHRLDRKYAFGIDWGKHADFTVISIFDIDRRQQVELIRFNQLGYTSQVGRLLDLYRIWKPQVIVAERNSMGEALIDFLLRDGLPIEGFYSTNETKRAVVDEMALAMERGHVHLLDDIILKSELKAFEMTRLPSGTFRYAAPEGYHDDCVIATVLSWHGVTSRTGIGAVVY